jgi:hypothetical protein
LSSPAFEFCFPVLSSLYFPFIFLTSLTSPLCFYFCFSFFIELLLKSVTDLQLTSRLRIRDLNFYLLL